MKKISIDTNLKQDLIAQFTDYINKLDRNTSSAIHFSTTIDNIVQQGAKPTIFFSSTAYLKMMLYVRDTDTEIAWHGVVERNIEKNWYHIKDVFLYPQIVRSATVDTDQEKYQEWLQNIEDDDIFNNIRFQGHSHVNMATTPSGTDLGMYDKFLQVLPKNDYYIFAIMNKIGSLSIYIYDLAKNTIYEPTDINIRILAPDTQNLLGDIEAAKVQYCEKPIYSTTYTNYKCGKLFDNTDDWEDDSNYFSRQKKLTDVNSILDDIDRKYKNTKLRVIKPKKKK